MQRAIDDTVDSATSKAGHIAGLPERMAISTSITGNTGQPGIFTTIDGEYTNPRPAQPATESMITLAHGTTWHDNIASPGPSHPTNATDKDLTARPASFVVRWHATECSRRRMSSVPPVFSGSCEHTAFSTGPNEPPEYPDTESHHFPLEPSALSRIAASLRHLRSGSDIPEGTFEGSTPDDISVLDHLCQSLSHILQEIDRNIAAVLRPAAERFDHHMQSSASFSASTARTCRYQAQEEWQTGRGKRTQWNPDADWDSDMAWTEVEVCRPAESHGPSKLRHTYVPCEWSRPLTEPPL